MKNVLASASSILLAANAFAADPIDSATFYASLPGQVFKGSSPDALTVGYVEGDEIPYQTWEGLVSGKKLYLELHGDKLQIQSGRHKVTRSLDSAFKLEREQSAHMDFRGTDLYVRQGKVAHNAALCIESLPAGVSRSMPHRSVYLVTDPLGTPRLYQLPTMYASCKGVVEVKPGIYTVPGWTTSTDTAPHVFNIQFYKLNTTGFAASDWRATATSIGEQFDQFIIETVR